MARKSWSDLSRTQQQLVVLGGVAEVVLTTVAVRDLVRRPASQVRGSKAGWMAAFVVQPFGPLAYLWRGRR